MIYLYLHGLPPSSNNAYFNLPRGGRALTKEGKRYLTETKVTLVRDFREAIMQFEANVPYLVAIRLTVLQLENATWPQAAKTRYKRFDASNRVKLLEDALKDAGGIDDSQHMTVLINKVAGANELTEIWAWNLEKEQSPFDQLLLGL